MTTRELLVRVTIVLFASLPAALRLPDLDFGRWTSLAPLLRELGRLTAVFGLGLLATALLLGLRWRALERVIGALDDVVLLHHHLGGTGYLLLLAHPLLLAAAGLTRSLDEGTAVLFSPAGGAALALGWLSLLAAMAVVPPSFVRRLPHRAWRLLHLAGWFAVFGGAMHSALARGTLGPSELLVVAIASAALVLRLVVGNSPLGLHPYLVTEVRHLAPDVSELVLVPQAKPLAFRAGQFVFARFHDPRTGWRSREYHPFTISSAPEGPRLHLTIKALGDATRRMVALQPGAKVELRGPFGRLFEGSAPGRQIWIAGGIGITPFLSAARTVHHAPPAVDLVYSARGSEEAWYLDELARMADREPWLRLHLHLDERDGLLDVRWLIQRLGALEGADYYIAGPGAFVRAIRSGLRRSGVAGERLHDERFEFL